MDLFFDRQGEPIDTLAWAELRRDLEYCTLAHDVVNGLRVSTVWIGIDMALHFGEEPHIPVIFETMIFGLPDDRLPCWRYPTEEVALSEHRRIVKGMRSDKHWLG